jgi:hypothetical protein
MKQRDSKSKSAKQTSKKRTATRQQPEINDALSRLAESNYDKAPASVRAFIEGLTGALGLNGAEYEGARAAQSLSMDAASFDADAFRTALNVALETLARYAPAVSYTPWDYQQQAEHFAAALLHHEAPKHFRETFEAIYDALLVNKTNWSHPSMIRATYNAMCEYLNDDNYCGNVEGIQQSLLQLIETQLPEHVKEAIYNSKTKGGATDGK